jgi:hypothetical protein
MPGNARRSNSSAMPQTRNGTNLRGAATPECVLASQERQRASDESCRDVRLGNTLRKDEVVQRAAVVRDLDAVKPDEVAAECVGQLPTVNAAYQR